jgi:very-short-patch-repair endonuclease
MSRDKKRYNVAVSRARNQLWLIHSLSYEKDLKKDDIRRGLLDYVYNYRSNKELIDKVSSKADSIFEKKVMAHLIEQKYTVVPQWKVGSYRIDIVVVDGDKKVAIECDGDRYHNAENLAKDLSRQAILERLGWNFYRIRGSQFFRDPTTTMGSVYAWLSDMGIRPVDSSDLDEGTNSKQEVDLVNKIITIAASCKDNTSNDISIGPVRKQTNVNKDTIHPPEIVRHQNPKKYDCFRSIVSTPAEVPITKKEKSYPYMQDNDIHVADEKKSLHTKEISIPSANNSMTNQDMECAPPSELSVQIDLNNLLAYFSLKKLTVVDNRSKGGALWVIGGKELKPIFDEIKQKGTMFYFNERGGSATNHKPAWWTRWLK